MKMDNARDPEQIRRMKALKESGRCYFCKEGSAEEKTLPVIINEGEYWYITKNDFPLDGSVHHYLIVPRRHVLQTYYLSPEERVELGGMEWWLAQDLKVSGYSMFVRSGDMSLTGATIDHCHYHFLVGGVKPEVPEGEMVPLDQVVPVVLAYKQK
ncbi:hypothetical protein H0W91_04060 [Patescibacteria group bacterium]|nr:hypothetical protein [Patescibacteria group bacterium]